MPNKRKKQNRVDVNDLDKPTKKLTRSEQQNVKGGLIIPGPHVRATTIGGALSNTIGGTLGNTVGAALGNTVGGTLGNTVGGSFGGGNLP